jgi:uncharacterized membrane protein YfcA
MPLTLSEWLIACAVLVLGAIVQGSVGFGIALLGAPVLFLLNPLLVPAPMLMVGLSLPALILLRDRHGLDPDGLRWALPGQLAGTALAGAVVASLPEDGLALTFGVLVLLAVAISAFARAPTPTRGHLLTAGSLSGFMATATSIGGPPLALVYQGVAGPRLRATLSSIFVPGGLASLTALYFAGRFGWAEFVAGLALLPAVAVGFWLSGFTARALDRAWLREAVLAVSGAAGAAAIIQGLL